MTLATRFRGVVLKVMAAAGREPGIRLAVMAAVGRGSRRDMMGSTRR